MALTPEDVAKLEEKLKAIERLSERLGENINTLNLRPVEENAGAINELFRSLNEKLEDVGSNTDYLASSFKNIIGEIRNSNTGVGELSKNLRGLSSISEQITQYQKGYTNLTAKDIAQLQNKTRIETNRLSITRSILQAEGIELERLKNSAGFADLSVAKQNRILKDLKQNEQAQESINNLLQNQDIILKDLNNELESAFNKAKKIEEVYGLSGAAVDSVNKALGKLGFGGLASQLGIDEAKSKMQSLSNEIVSNIAKEEKARERINTLSNESASITNQLNELGTKAVNTQNKLVDITEKLNELKAKGDKANKDELAYYERYKKELEEELTLERKVIGDLQSKNNLIQENIKAESKELEVLQEFNKTHDGINGKLAVMKAGFSSMKDALIKNLKDPLVIIGFLTDQIIDAFKASDTATGDLAKSFNLTYDQAVGVRNELIQIGNLSGNVALNARSLQESMIAVGQSLGSNAMLNQQDLETFTELREMAGYTNEELVGMQKLTLATGGNLKDNTKQFLGTVTALNAQNKLTVNAKQLLKEVSNVSAAIKLSIGGTTEKLAEAAFKAKQFGINLEQADKMSESLLDFESSINNQISAELITGKSLNLEKARLLALNGNIAEASAEILQQVGGTAEFTRMNRIQQEALAKAVGLSRDELANSLMEREALAELSAVEGKDAKEKFDNLVKQVGLEEAKKRIGNEQYANQLAQQSVQERFSKTIEKLKEVFISLVEPLLPVLDTFMLLVKPISIIAGLLGQVTGFIGKIIGSGPGMVVLFSTLGLILLPKILSGVGSIGSGLASGAKSLKNMVTSSFDLVKNLAKGNIKEAFTGKPGEKFGKLREKVEAKKSIGEKTPEVPDTSKVGEGGEKMGKKGLTAGFKDNMTNIAEGFKAMGQDGVGKGIFNTMLAGPALVVALPSIPFLLFMGKVKLDKLVSNFEDLALGLDAMGSSNVLKGIGNTLLAGPALLIANAALPFIAIFGKVGLNQLLPNFENLALGLDAMGTGNTKQGGIALLIASPGLALATIGVPFLAFMGKVGLNQLLPNFENLALGLDAMAPTFVGSAALATFGLASIVALPSLLFLGGIALLGEVGAAGLVALSGGLEALGMAAATGLPFIAIGLITALGASMIPFAYALNVAAPGIEAFGRAIKSTFEGIVPIITAATDGISKIFTTLGNIDADKLLLLGPALIGIGAGLAALGGGGVIGAVGGAISKLFGSKGPIETLTELSKLGEPLNLVSTSIQNTASALTQLSASLAQIDISKLEAISKISNESKTVSITSVLTTIPVIGSAVKSVGSIFDSALSLGKSFLGIKSPESIFPTLASTPTPTIAPIGENVKIAETSKTTTEKEKVSEKISMPELTQMLDELKAIKAELAASNKKPVIIENSMNGTKFGTSVAMNTRKTQ